MQGGRREFCPRCRHGLGRTDIFCPRCGLKLTHTPTTQEHRFVTVLCSDISGYSTLSELLDPEELKDLVDGLFTSASRIIRSYGGIVEKFIGDEVLALFGIDHIHEDDSIRAIMVALEIHRCAESMDHILS
ncbi:MAG: adenylate/guanylate cyclase domain-containing protein, partial [Desulfomonilia bacterium]